MRKFTMLSMLIVLTIGLIGCVESDADAYNIEGFKHVKEYTEAILPVVDDTIKFSEQWIEENSNDNFEQMVQAANEIGDVNESLFMFNEDDEYNKEEIESWTVDLSLEAGEWVIEGKELYSVLTNVKNDSEKLTDAITKLKDNNKENVEQLTTKVQATKKSSDALREMMRR